MEILSIISYITILGLLITYWIWEEKKEQKTQYGKIGTISYGIAFLISLSKITTTIDPKYIFSWETFFQTIITTGIFFLLFIGIQQTTKK